MNFIVPNIIVFGPPGSGKTTIGQILAAALKWGPHFIDMSRVCKVAGAFDRDFSLLSLAHMAKGTLVPNESVLPMFETYMKSYEEHERFVLSGVVRDPEQAQIFGTVKAFMSKETPLHILKVKLTPEEAVRRCRERAEKDRLAGKKPRETDLNDALNRQRVIDDEKRESSVIESIVEAHGSPQIFEIETQPEIPDTLSLAVDALSIRPHLLYPFPVKMAA